MKALRTILLFVAFGAVVAAGIVAGRRLSPQRRPKAPIEATLAQADSLYRQDGPAGAAARYEDALRRSPEDADTRVKLARIYLEDRDYARALPHLKAAIKTQPDCAQAYSELARVFASRGRGYAPQATALALKAAKLGYPIPESFLQELEKLEKENARAKREGRACPDNPMPSLDGARVAPHLLQRPPE